MVQLGVRPAESPNDLVAAQRTAVLQANSLSEHRELACDNASLRRVGLLGLGNHNLEVVSEERGNRDPPPTVAAFHVVPRGRVARVATRLHGTQVRHLALQEVGNVCS
jgi:hypothetical protein